MKVRLAGVVKESVVDGPGIRYTIFFQGCKHNCWNCHNPNTHDFLGGYEIDIESLYQEIIKNPILDGVTFSGGEPLFQPEVALTLARKIKLHDLSLIIYTGFSYEELCQSTNSAILNLLQIADYLIDGPYIDELRDLTLLFRGSTNQRFIDLKNKVVLDKADVIKL